VVSLARGCKDKARDPIRFEIKGYAVLQKIIKTAEQHPCRSIAADGLEMDPSFINPDFAFEYTHKLSLPFWLP
jgi:hypothetical protein